MEECKYIHSYYRLVGRRPQAVIPSIYSIVCDWPPDVYTCSKLLLSLLGNELSLTWQKLQYVSMKASIGYIQVIPWKPSLES